MKIAILTNFAKFFPGYSLTGIVQDKARMLAKYGHEVHLFVSKRYKGESFSKDVILEKEIPFAHLKDYKSVTELSPEHKMVMNATAAVLSEQLVDYDLVMTEDFIFQGWNLPYALGVIEASKRLEKPRWMHWVHSVPTVFRDWWDIKLYGKKHKIVYPNESDRLRVAEQFRGIIDDVVVIPHIKDVRTWEGFLPEANEIIDWAPALMNADVVQVYPCSVDRLPAKGLSEVISVFSFLKKSMKSVCLFLATQWATGKKQWDILDGYKREATEKGLVVGKEIVFSADYKVEKGSPKYGVGLPREILRDLVKLSNLFMFPTREESFGLVLPEACLGGSPLTVLNKSLSMMQEIAGFNGLFFDFGSYHQNVNIPEHERERRLQMIAQIILGRMMQDDSIRTRTFMRQKYNMDYLYHNYYAPTLANSRSWI